MLYDNYISIKLGKTPKFKRRLPFIFNSYKGSLYRIYKLRIRKLRTPIISHSLCIYIGIELSCLYMRCPVWDHAWTRLLPENLWGSWKTRTVRETGLRTQRIKLVSSSWRLLTHTNLQHLSTRSLFSLQQSQNPIPSHVCSTCVSDWGPPPFLWHLKSESCLIYHSPFCFQALIPVLLLLGHSSSAPQVTDCWQLPSFGLLPHLDIWNWRLPLS